MKDINLAGLGMFGGIATHSGESGRDILQLGKKGSGAKVSAKYRGWNVLGRLGRSSATEAANNITRTQFLEALAEAFGYELKRNGDTGNAVFTKDFMDMLEQHLGKDVFKRSNFGVDEAGNVTSGSPLTERRITAIVDRVYELKGVGSARKALRNTASAVDAAMNARGLAMADDNGRPLSPSELAKVVLALHERKGGPEAIQTLGQFKELVETTTGRTCSYLEHANKKVVFSYADDVCRIMMQQVDNAQILQEADAQVERTSLKTRVATENQKSLGARMTQLRDEIKQSAEYRNHFDQTTVDRYLDRLFDPQRPYPKTVSAKLLRFVARDMLVNGTKPFAVRLALEVYDKVLRNGFKPLGGGSLTERLTKFAKEVAEKVTPVIQTKIQEISGYTMTPKSHTVDADTPDFIADGATDGSLGDGVREIVHLLFRIIREENSELREAMGLSVPIDLKELEMALDKVDSQKKEFETPTPIDERRAYTDTPDSKKLTPDAELTSEISVLGIQQLLMNRMYVEMSGTTPTSH